MYSQDQRLRPIHKLPQGACDSHCHVFGPAAVFPYAPDRRYTPDDAPKEALASLHRRIGITRAVIVQASCHGTDNRAMLDCIATDPKRFRGVAIVDDSFDSTQLKALHDGGVRGVRFNFVKHLGGAPDMAVFDRVMERIKPLGWHVVLHIDAPDIIPLTPMMQRLTVPFVIDHMGRIPATEGVLQEPFQALLRLVENPLCWIKVSGAERIAEPPFTSAIAFATQLMLASPNRVMWGTDFPHPNLKHEVDEADLVDLLPHYTNDPTMLERLLVTNPATLYGFEQ